MKRLTPNDMALVGAGRCGGALSSMIIEGTFATAGGFIGWGLTSLNPAGAYYGATIGFGLGQLLCRS